MKSKNNHRVQEISVCVTSLSVQASPRDHSTFILRLDITIFCNLKLHFTSDFWDFPSQVLNSFISFPKYSYLRQPNIVRVVKSRRMRWAGHVARMGEDSVVHRVLVGKPEGKRPLGRPRRRWVDNIKMELQEVGGGRGDWMELAQDRDRWRALVGTVRNFRFP